MKNYWYNFINIIFDTDIFRNTLFFKTPLANIFILPKRLTGASVYMIITYLKKNGITKQQFMTYYREVEKHWEEIDNYSFLKSIVK